MTITRASDDIPGVTYEQDVDEFFKEMAQPCVVIMPYRLSDEKEADESLSIWVDHGEITQGAKEVALKEWSGKYPIDTVPIDTGHTKGYILMKHNKFNINCRKWWELTKEEEK